MNFIKRIMSAVIMAVFIFTLNMEAARATDKIKICHATHSETNPYVLNEPSAAGVYNGHIVHQDVEDIIPPFEWRGTTYSQNWDDEGRAIWNNGCVKPVTTTTVNPTTTTTMENTTTTVEPTTTTVEQSTTTTVVNESTTTTLDIGTATSIVRNEQPTTTAVSPTPENTERGELPNTGSTLIPLAIAAVMAIAFGSIINWRFKI